MKTRLSIPVGKVLHWDVEVFEVDGEDPSGTESSTGHGGPRPHEPWISDNTGEGEHDGGGDGLIEEGERVDETLHSGGGSGVSELVRCHVDE